MEKLVKYQEKAEIETVDLLRDWDKLVSGFIKNRMRNKRIRSERSVKTYRRVLSIFKDYLEFGLKDSPETWEAIYQPQLADVIKWQAELLKGLTIATVNLYTVTIKSFFKYLFDQGIYGIFTDEGKISPDQIFIIKTEPLDDSGENRTHKRGYIRLEWFNEMLSHIDPDKLSGLRDGAILSIMFYAGLRVAGVATLRHQDFKFIGNKYYLDVKEKARKKRTKKPIPPTVARNIIQYQNRLKREFQTSDDDPLFISVSNGNRGQGLGISGIEYIVNQYIKRLVIGDGLKANLTAHSFRHGCGTTLAGAGVSIRYIQILLGHRDIKTTEIYLHDLEKDRAFEEIGEAWTKITGGGNDGKEWQAQASA